MTDNIVTILCFKLLTSHQFYDIMYIERKEKRRKNTFQFLEETPIYLFSSGSDIKVLKVNQNFDSILIFFYLSGTLLNPLYK